MKAVQRIRAALAAAYKAACDAHKADPKNNPPPRFDAEGRELVDSTPVEMPLAFKRKQMDVHAQIQRALRSHLVMQAQEQRGEETLDDMLDFGHDDDPTDGLPVSPHEIRDMQVQVLKEGAIESKRPKPKKQLEQKQPEAPAK